MGGDKRKKGKGERKGKKGRHKKRERVKMDLVPVRSKEQEKRKEAVSAAWLRVRTAPYNISPTARQMRKMHKVMRAGYD